MKVKDLLKVLSEVDPEMYVDLPFDYDGLGGHEKPTWVGINNLFGIASLVITSNPSHIQPDEIDLVLWKGLP